MNKALIAMFAALLLSISFVSAKLIPPEIVPVDPIAGGTVSGNYTLQIKLEYPSNVTGDKAEPKQVMFRYIRPNCTQTCKVVIGNDLSDAFGWKTVWDTTSVPDGDYNLQFYAFAEGGNLLLAQKMIQIRVDQSYTRPAEEEEAPQEQPEENISQPPAEVPSAPPKAEPKKEPVESLKKPSFWIRFLTWLKSLFS